MLGLMPAVFATPLADSLTMQQICRFTAQIMWWYDVLFGCQL